MRLRTPALLALIAVGCLLVGSTGGAVAGAMITGAQIKNGSLTGKDVKDKSLTTKDLSPASLSDLTGADGAPGTPGTNGVSGYKFTFGVPANAPASATGNAFAACPAGKRVTGGGGMWINLAGTALDLDNVLATSAPAHAVRDGSGNATSALVISDGTSVPDAWIVGGTNHDAAAADLVAYVICANVS